MQIDQFNSPAFSPEIRETIRSWGVTQFTNVQVEALNAGVVDGRSQVVSAPTSSGKTLVGELAILGALARGLRCIYLVSHKALADQKFLDFEARFGSRASRMIATVGLSTGDREEGEISPTLLIATYEKALALLLAGQLDLGACLVVADELQIIGEDGRGANIETLCSIIKMRGVSQFVALTATIGNASDLADWLGCQLVVSHNRDINLHQEIWTGSGGYRVCFGQEQGEAFMSGQALPTDTIRVVRQLLAMQRGPVLVFTESRREATDLATSYSQTCVNTTEGIALAQELELFSEPTESSQQLQDNAQKRVAFHSADLTAQERQVIETGFARSNFDVCFATSTLAAGVNFPFRSVVFHKLTYQWGDRQGTLLSRSDYRNMSGRAGRLGLHPDGYAILIPKNRRELDHANAVILPANDNVASRLVTISMRRTVLALIAFGAVSTRDGLTAFFQNTLYWHQIRDRNPAKLEDVIASANRSVDWLAEHKLIEEDFGFFLPTPVGKAVAQSGLLPTTAVNFLEMMTQHAPAISASFETYITGILHWICTSPEFAGSSPTRFLPYPTGRRPTDSTGLLQSQPLLTALNRTDERTNQCVHALLLFSRGDADRQIRFQTNIPSGQLHRLATDIAWVLDGLRKIASVPSLGYAQTLTNQFAMLARQVQWGAPSEALDILRVANREGVPGFGRQRAVALLRQGIQTFDTLLATAADKLSALIGNERRVTALLSAVAATLGFKTDRFRKVHKELAAKLGIPELLQACEDEFGTAYEAAIIALLRRVSVWNVTVLDDGIKQNVPDILVTLDDLSILIECKTTAKNPPLIKKEEAFAVLQKAVDYHASMKRVTLGKPAFDEHSKKKVQAANDVTLVEHDTFVEGVLRTLAGEITAKDFLLWISQPGLTELDRLGGRASYELIRA